MNDTATPPTLDDAGSEAPLVAKAGAEVGVETAGRTIVLMSAWFGLLTGLLELAAGLIRDLVDHRVSDALLRVNQHWTWMVLVSDLALFGAVGLVLGGLALVWPRRVLRLGPSVLTFLSALGLVMVARGLYLVAYIALALGIAVWLARRSEGQAEGRRRLIRWSLPVLAAVAAAVIGIEYRRVSTSETRALAGLPSARRGAPNVILMVLDTVRADGLSLYGYPRATSPNLAQFAARGVRFDQARSTAPWTLPSHASMFTGHWPRELGVRDSHGLGTAFPTLAEHLSARGYTTAGFVGNTHFCNTRYGLSRGFVHFEDYPEKRQVTPVEILGSSMLGLRLIDLGLRVGVTLPGVLSPRKQADQINRDLLAWLDNPARGDRPFFAFLNYIDAHDPYELPPGGQHRFGLRPETAADRKLIATWFDGPKNHLTPRDLTLARDSYDNCLAYLDDQLGRLFAELQTRGLLDNTIVVVTADHGEAFGEHQLFGHGRSLYRPEVQVPLLIVGPGNIPAGRIVSEPVSLRDLPETILDLAAVAGGSPFPGDSLARHWGPTTEAASIEDEVLISEVAHRPEVITLKSPVPALKGPMESVVAAGKVYIRNADGREELYDIAGDPTESHNLSASPASRELLKWFREYREHLRRGDPPPRPMPPHGGAPVVAR